MLFVLVFTLSSVWFAAFVRRRRDIPSACPFTSMQNFGSHHSWWPLSPSHSASPHPHSVSNRNLNIYKYILMMSPLINHNLFINFWNTPPSASLWRPYSVTCQKILHKKLNVLDLCFTWNLDRITDISQQQEQEQENEASNWAKAKQTLTQIEMIIFVMETEAEMELEMAKRHGS